MATVFPGQIDTFPTLKDVTAADGTLIAQYQAAIQSGNITQAKSILLSITEGENKVITAEYLNDIHDALTALETYYLQRWSPAYIVSDTQPLTQAVGDFWFDTGDNS